MKVYCFYLHRPGNLKKYYPSKTEKDSEYYIALQIILENFVHFLIGGWGVKCPFSEFPCPCFGTNEQYQRFQLFPNGQMSNTNGFRA